MIITSTSNSFQVINSIPLLVAVIVFHDAFYYFFCYYWLKGRNYKKGCSLHVLLLCICTIHTESIFCRGLVVFSSIFSRCLYPSSVGIPREIFPLKNNNINVPMDMMMRRNIVFLVWDVFIIRKKTKRGESPWQTNYSVESPFMTIRISGNTKVKENCLPNFPQMF